MDKPNDLTPIIEQYHKGTCPRVIGKSYGDFGVTAQSIRNWLKSAGVKMRPKGGRNHVGNCSIMLGKMTLTSLRKGIEECGFRGLARDLGVHESCLHLNWRNRTKRV